VASRKSKYQVLQGASAGRSFSRSAARYHGRVLGNIGPLEIAIVLIIALIIFGPKRLPELGRSLGKGIREFRGSIGGDDDEDSRQASAEIEAGKGEPVAHKRP
jgi:sec-independent protein translocase protein TatA